MKGLRGPPCMMMKYCYTKQLFCISQGREAATSCWSFVCGFLLRAGTALRSCPLHLSSHLSSLCRVFLFSDNIIALISCIFKPEKSSITAYSLCHPLWGSSTRLVGAQLPVQLGKMELINVLVLKFVFQRVISRDVSWKSPSLGLDIQEVGLDMSVMVYPSYPTPRDGRGQCLGQILEIWVVFLPLRQFLCDPVVHSWHPQVPWQDLSLYF